MFTILRTITLVLFGLVVTSGSTLAGTSEFQGTVKGPDGKPIAGAELRLQRKGAKTAAASSRTDTQGRYIFKNLDLAEYTLSASANGMATAKVEGLKTRADGAVNVSFDLKKQAGTAEAAPAKAQKRRVWVKETGSNLGRWVEVEETEASATGQKVKRHSASALEGMRDGGTGMPGN